jgi:monothiol glutaredoxin
MKSLDRVWLLPLSGFTGKGIDSESLGLKEYSDWPTIPQLYVDKEFVGGCDILMSMHQNGELSKMLEEKGVLVPAEASPEQ